MIISGTIALDAGTISNTHVAAGAAIEASKLQQRHIHGTRLNLAIGATPVAREEIIHVARGAGIVREFIAILNDTGTTTNVSFILKKNGSTILSANATITHSNADREVVAGTINSAAYVAGDVFSIELTVTSSTGAQGPWAQATFDETPA